MRLLSVNPNRQEAVGIILSDPDLTSEAVAALPEIRDVAQRGCGAEGVKRVIGRRLETYPQPQRSAVEWGMWWADYIDALHDLPEAKLEAGMAAWVKSPDSRFMPKPGELRALAETASWTSPAFEAWSRAQQVANTMAMRNAPVPSEAPRERAKPEEISALMADFKAQWAERFPDKPKPAPRPVRGPTDDRGLTEAMRSHLSSQRA